MRLSSTRSQKRASAATLAFMLVALGGPGVLVTLTDLSPVKSAAIAFGGGILAAGAAYGGQALSDRGKQREEQRRSRERFDAMWKSSGGSII